MTFDEAIELAHKNVCPVVFTWADGYTKMWKPSTASLFPSRFRLAPRDKFIHGVTYWLSPFGQYGDFRTFNFYRYSND